MALEMEKASTVRKPQANKAIQSITGWRLWLLWIGSLIIRLWCRTLRFTMTPEDKANLSNQEKPTVVILWHNRLFPAAAGYLRFRRKRSVYGLISASRDGAWLVAFLKILGVHALRGSTSWRGAEVLREAMQALEAGSDIVITPDGPRGPCYDVKPGAALIAKQTHAPILLISGTLHRSWRLKSWDRFYVPKPFSKVTVKTHYFDNFDALHAESEPSYSEAIYQQLMAITEDPE